MGLPGPTTGISRSLLALFAGDVGRSLHFHPLAVPLLGIFIYVILRTLHQVAWRRRLRLGGFGSWGLFGLLAVSWVVKFITGPETW